jgi:hypothetical protein
MIRRKSLNVGPSEMERIAYVSEGASMVMDLVVNIEIRRHI